MDKIVISTDRLKECEPLISCLKFLFPECEIQVQPKHAKGLKHPRLTVEPSKACRMDIEFARNLRKIMAENHA
jgi:hypothetical protein